MKVLHITSWFPNRDNEYEAPWIKNHIDSLSSYCENEIWHIRTIENRPLSYLSYELNGVKHRILYLPTSRWFFIELATFFQLTLFSLFNYSAIRKADVINFHIAYPSLTYWKYLKYLIKKPIIITEHWSAYHFNFGLPPLANLDKIKRVFKNGIPVIGVSNALINDIKSFSNSDFPHYIIPNIINKSIFCYDKFIKRENYFFMVSQWKWPKKPQIVLSAFKQFLIKHPSFKLKIGGYGSEYSSMKNWVKGNNLNESIEFLDVLCANEVSYHLKRCSSFLHCSEYETFSVVCAEAISCHTPVLASKVGGILEVVEPREGILIDSFSAEDWENAMEKSMNQEFIFNNDSKFSKESIGLKYHHVLLNYCHETS